MFPTISWKSICCEASSGLEAYKKINPLCKVPALRHDDLILYESGAIAYYIDAKFGPGNEPLVTRWLDWELSLADAFARLSRQYVDAHIVRSLHARPHFVQVCQRGPLHTSGLGSSTARFVKVLKPRFVSSASRRI